MRVCDPVAEPLAAKMNTLRGFESSQHAVVEPARS
jgi:hypothetical protein